MKVVKIVLLSLYILCSAFANAQTQMGYVKTLGRPDRKGKALAGVIVRVTGEHNTVLSKSDGTFSMRVTGKRNGDAYSLQLVQKVGYELNEKGVLGRLYAFSDKVPLTIVMVSTAQLKADKQRIENNAYKVAEKNYKSKLVVLEKKIEEHTISAEQYKAELQDLQNNFENYQSLIDELSDHYAHVDYDNLDEHERDINLCIENGDLERADSLICTIFDPIDVIKRNKDALACIEKDLHHAHDILKIASADMAAILKQQQKDAEHLYQLFTIALTRHDIDKAKLYIETRAELDTTNVEWQNIAGKFINDFLSDYQKGFYYFKRALNVSICKFGELSELTACCYNNLGYVFSKMANHDKALEYAGKALNIRRSIYEKDNPSIGYSYINIGMEYLAKDLYIEALTFFYKALAIFKGQSNPSDTDLALCYNNIGGALECLGKYESAIDHYLYALSIREKHFGTNSLMSALSYNCLGSVFFHLQDFAKALEYFKKSLEIRKAILGEKHTDVAKCYNNIGLIYVQNGEYKLGKNCITKAYDIIKNIHSEKHSEIGVVYNNLGLLFERQGQDGIALKYFEKALNIFQSNYGKSHIYIAACYFNIGRTYQNKHQFLSSEYFFQKAFDIMESILGKTNFKLISYYEEIGNFYQQIKQNEKSIFYYERAYELVKLHYGDKSERASLLENTINILKSSEHVKKEFRILQDLLDLKQKNK